MRRFAPFLVRDGALTIAAAVLVAIDAELRATAAAGTVALAIGTLAGVMVVVASFLAHEWGHLIAAVASGARVQPPSRLRSPFLFFFDVARSTRRQFLWMSAGGYLASVIGIAAILGWADWSSTSGRVALVLAGIGLLVTIALEVPTTWRVARGGPLPTGAVYVDGSDAG